MLNQCTYVYDRANKEWPNSRHQASIKAHTLALSVFTCLAAR